MNDIYLILCLVALFVTICGLKRISIGSRDCAKQ